MTIPAKLRLLFDFPSADPAVTATTAGEYTLNIDITLTGDQDVAEPVEILHSQLSVPWRQDLWQDGILTTVSRSPSPTLATTPAHPSQVQVTIPGVGQDDMPIDGRCHRTRPPGSEVGDRAHGRHVSVIDGSRSC